MDYLPNKFLSLGFLLFLTWWIHTYVEIFAYIVNIIWAPLEIFLWETIHSSRLEEIHWSLRETSCRHHQSNRVIELYSSLARTQTKPKCDLNPASIPTIADVVSIIPSIHPPKKTEVLIHRCLNSERMPAVSPFDDEKSCFPPSKQVLVGQLFFLREKPADAHKFGTGGVIRIDCRKVAPRRLPPYHFIWPNSLFLSADQLI